MAQWSWVNPSRRVSGVQPLSLSEELPLPTLSRSLSLSHSRVGNVGVGNLLQDGVRFGDRRDRKGNRERGGVDWTGLGVSKV